MNIEIDLSGLKIKDLVLFENAGKMTQTQLVELLDRVVVGGASELPLTQLRTIIAAVKAKFQELSNPLDAEKKA